MMERKSKGKGSQKKLSDVKVDVADGMYKHWSPFWATTCAWMGCALRTTVLPAADFLPDTEMQNNMIFLS